MSKTLSLCKGNLSFKCLSTDESRWDMLLKLGNSLLSSKHPNSDIIQSKLDDLLSRRNYLEHVTRERERNLVAAHEVYLYIDKTQEIQSWIADKVIALSIEDVGKNLATSEALLRHHLVLVRDLVVLEESVKQLESDSSILLEKHAKYTDIILETQADLISCWECLRQNSDRRGLVLSDSQRFQRFLRDSSDIITWISDMKQLIESDSVPSTLPDATSLLERILEYEGELTARNASFLCTIAFGNSLLTSNHSEVLLISERIEELQLTVESLKNVLNSKRCLLDQHLDLLHYFRQCTHIDDSLSLLLDEIDCNAFGNTWEETDGRIKFLQNLDRTFQAYCDNVNKLQIDSTSLTLIFPQNHLIHSTISNLKELKDRIYNIIVEYSANLHSVRLLHEYVRELIDWKEWIQEQRCDISQDHLSDIEQALQTHDVFVNEVSINSERILCFIQKGKCLQLPLNFNTQYISRGINELSNEWDKLNMLCSLKRETLVNDSASLQYSTELDKIALWLGSTEKLCNSQELGKDIISASIIQKTLRNLEHDVTAHKQRFTALVLDIYDFFPIDHKSLPSLKNLIRSITVRVEEISSSYKQRCIVIDQSCFSFHLLLQIADEQDWVDEKLSLLESCDTVNDLIQAQKMLKKFELLMADFNLRENRINMLQIELNTIDSFPHCSTINLAFETLNNQWSHLRVVTRERNKYILHNISIQQYFSDCFEANVWLREIETLISGGAVAKDEDSALVLICKLEALLSDIKFFSQTLTELHTSCEFLVSQPISTNYPVNFQISNSENTKEYVKCKYDYTARRPQELSIQKGDVAILLASINDDWWKLEYPIDRIGYVPANYLERVLAPNDSEIYMDYSNNPSLKQTEIEDLYQYVLGQCEEKLHYLSRLHEYFTFKREIKELFLWIQEANSLGVTIDSQSSNLESADRSKSTFEELLTQVWSYESRVLLIAEQKVLLSHSMGDNTDLDTLLIEWDQLLGDMDRRKQSLSDLFILQKSSSDINEAISWINDINISATSDNFGKDLASVQMLLREHEMVENTHKAIQSLVEKLRINSASLFTSNPMSQDFLFGKLTEMNGSFDLFSNNISNRALHLQAGHYLQRFLTEQRDILFWITSLKGQIYLGELSHEISGAEALLMRIEELKIEIYAREDNYNSVYSFGFELIQDDHFSKQEISSRLDELKTNWLELNDVYHSQESKVIQLLALLLFFRDVDQSENWILLKNTFITNIESDVSLDGIQLILRNINELFDSLLVQDVKVSGLQDSATTLIQSRHYASAVIAEKRVDILQKWNCLKSLVSDKRDDVVNIYSLHQFLLDAADIEGWISDKCETCVSDSFKTSTYTSIEHFCQRQETSRAEVATHDDRITKLISVGQQLIDTAHCHGKSEVIYNRINSLKDNWLSLLSRFEDRSLNLANTKDEFEFSLAIRSKINWIEETTALLKPKEIIYDVEYAETEFEDLEHIQVELDAGITQILDLNTAAQELLTKKYTNEGLIKQMSDKLLHRYDELSNMFGHRKSELLKDLNILRYLRSLDQEDSWLRDKMLLTAVEDFGKDLIGVQRLRKKHQRFELELLSHENTIHRLVSQCNTLKISENNSEFISIIQEKCRDVNLSLIELQSNAITRTHLLNESEKYQQLSSNFQEEETWLIEKFNAIFMEENFESLALLQDSLSQVETFTSDFQVHHNWIKQLILVSENLQKDGNLHSEAIYTSSLSIKSRLNDLDSRIFSANERLDVSKTYMEYSHRIDLVESWISLRELEIQSSEIGEGNVISYIESLIRKHDTLENTLQVFQHDGIDPLMNDKSILLNHGKFDVATFHLKLEDIEKRWNFLNTNTNERKCRLLRSLELSIKIDDLFLSFAKKASAFYSWFESSEEDLMETVSCSSIEETDQLRNHDVHFIGTLSWAQTELKQLLALDRQIKSFTNLPNPYTWYTHDSLQESWSNLQSIIDKRQSALDKECMRQERNDKLKRLFAEKANLFHSWIFNTRRIMVENTGQLHEQLELLRFKFENISEKQTELSVLERLSCELQDEMILDNSYTQHTSVALSQQWDQLSQLGRRMIYNLQQQILSKNMTGVSEEDMKDFQTLFNVYDEDRSGKLEEKEFKSCLISLGYSLQFLEKEQKDSEYENILDQVDPKRLGYITLEEFMSFHISRRTEKVKSREELEDAFRAITTDEKSTSITKDELNRALGTELQEFCLQYMNSLTSFNSASLDYLTFTRSLFMS